MKLGVEPRDARLFMVFDGRYKLMHAEGGFRPDAFRPSRPIRDEFQDLAKDGDTHKAEIDRLYDQSCDLGQANGATGYPFR